jgi:hypothetical protein
MSAKIIPSLDHGKGELIMNVFKSQTISIYEYTVNGF